MPKKNTYIQKKPNKIGTKLKKRNSNSTKAEKTKLNATD